LHFVFDFLFPRPKNGDRAAAADPSVEPVGRGQPTIGLALGGGAARGFAHIGVLRALISRGLKPDVITGTSVGAVVGGCYAAGQLDGIEEWARGLTPRRVLWHLDFSLSGSGLISGGRLAARLEKGLGKISIEDLPLRFAAIATELGTGHEIWLTRGNLAQALRASYSLPGIFAPVRLGGRWLVDGALVNPVPVAATRALGARLVIAVNLNADLLGRGATITDHGSDADNDPYPVPPLRSLRSLFGRKQMLKQQFLGEGGRPAISSVMVDAFNVMQDRIARARLAGDPPDVLISPRLGRLGLFEFHRAAEAIALGVEATEKALDQLGEAIAVLARAPAPPQEVGR
jgi:NTE family protein